MSDAKKVWNTDDPILLAALNAEETALIAEPPKRRKNDDTAYRGISRKSKDGQWRVEVGANGKDYNLGYYKTDHEAALARNYGEALVPGAKKVNNKTPPDTITPEVQKKIAAEVVARLRGYGVLPTTERNGDEVAKATEVTDKPAPPTAPPPQPKVPEATVAQNERIKKQIKDMVSDTQKGE